MKYKINAWACLNKIDYYLNMLLFIETVRIFTVLLDMKENISRE